MACNAPNAISSLFEDAGDLLAGSQPILHDSLALGALPVADLFAGDLDIWELLLDNLLDSIRTANGGFMV